MKKIFFLSICILSFSILHLSANSVAHVDFDFSMARNKDYDKVFASSDAQWLLFKSLYNSYCQQPVPTNGPYIIPPMIHFIWLGSPLPDRCKPLVASWQKKHPDWTVKVWSEADLESFNMMNRKAFDQAKNYGEKSDIWRYEILERFGGVYVDTDFECVKPFDAIHKSCDLYAGVAYGKNPVLYNGLIGAAPHHPIITLCMNLIQVGPGDHDSTRIMMATGPLHFTHCFFKLARILSGKVVPFPLTFFYPYPNVNRFMQQDPLSIKKEWLRPESHALHYWACSWVKGSKPNKKK